MPAGPTWQLTPDVLDTPPDVIHSCNLHTRAPPLTRVPFVLAPSSPPRCRRRTPRTRVTVKLAAHFILTSPRESHLELWDIYLITELRPIDAASPELSPAPEFTPLTTCTLPRPPPIIRCRAVKPQSVSHVSPTPAPPSTCQILRATLYDAN